MTILPAVVTIQDLPAGTTLSGTELLEAVQTSGGIAQSVQISVNQIMTTGRGALPTGGGTGQVLQSLGTAFAATWVNIASSVLASTGLAQSGATTVALSLASTAGLSVLGVGGASSAVPAAIAGTADQVLIVNHGATAVVFGPVNLATSAAVTGVLPGANFSAVNLATTGAGGVQGILQSANITAINLGTTGAGGIQTAQPFFQPTTVPTPGGTINIGIKLTAATAFGFFVGTGPPTFAAGTGSLYLNNTATTATTRLYVNANGSTSWANFTASL